MKKHVLSIFLVLSIVMCGLPSFTFESAATGEMLNVTVNAADGGKVSTDGTSWSDSVVVSVANGATIGDSVQYKPDEGYKLDGVTSAVVIKKIAASATNTAAIDDAGNLYTAGDNSCGQLARKLGSYVYEDSVLTKVSTSAKIIDVAMGRDHIVVLDENGEVWTAGCNQYGALGIDENAGKYWYGTYIETLRKVTVGNGSVKIRAVAAGQFHTILIDENGGVWTAGYNSDGQLGKSENINSGTPNKVFEKAEGLDNVKIVAASGGTSHTVLLDESGNVWTAGNNVYGELGRQTEKNVDSKFEKVTDGISGVKITAIAAGSSYTVLLDENGNVWTVGNNRYGDLGRETNDVSSSVFGKADLQGATAAKFIAAGGTTIVIDTDGNVRTSGINGHGQLGRDTGSESSDWKLLAVTEGIDGAEIIAAATGAGSYHSVLLDKNGVIRTCGANQCDQLCRNADLKKSGTFAPVTDGMTQTMTFDEMKNTVINSDREFTITSAIREKVQLEYELNGGEWADGFTPRDFVYKDEGLLLPDASNIKKPGYTFVEWEIPSLTSNPIKCYAKWTANTYTVTFDANGGTVTPDTMAVTYNEEFDQMPVPVRMGYVFSGWFDEQLGGKQYGDENGHSTAEYDKTENCTLYAQWIEVDCTVTFDPNGGTLTGPATSEEKQNGPIGEPDVPVREGYSFAGWYKDVACTQPWNFSDWVTGDMTLYAGWTVNQYTITIKPENGGDDITIKEDYGTEITAPTLTRTGYIFAGWDKEFPTTMPAGDLTITAQWTLCCHEGSTAQPTCTDSAVCTVCGGTIAALGHDFSVQQHDDNEHWKKCSRCDATDDKAPHDWDNGEITTPFTCMEEGEKTFTCNECNAIKTEPINASGHNWSQEWQHDATHHWHECLNDYCDVKDNNSLKEGYSEHTGGTATCTEKAKCEVCGEKYGELDPDNHTGETEWIKTETTHEQKYSCCGEVTVEEESHEWKDGVCSECEYVCLHEDTDENHICDICDKVISNHTDTDKNHVCDYCGKTISNHEDTDKNHICDYCGKIISNHEDTDKNHVCDYCGKIISNHEDTDNNHICDYCGKTISNHEDTDKNHICDYCGKIISNHEDTDNNHICNYCGKIISNHEDTDNNHICDLCGKVITNHTDGMATCTEKAECEICHKPYGELDPDNHTGETEWIKTETTHEQKYSCCGEVTVEEENHEWKDGVCEECGYACEHVYDDDSDATCNICGHERKIAPTTVDEPTTSAPTTAKSTTAATTAESTASSSSDKPVNTGAEAATGLALFMLTGAIGVIALKRRKK